MVKLKNNAFTLAEVLITLGIIGVIAALTIPILINASQEAEFNTGIKKAYSTLSQAVLTLQSTQDSINVGQPDFGFGLRTDLCSVLHCSDTDILVNIWGASSDYSYYKGGSMPLGWPDGNGIAAAELNNGNLLYVTSYNGCTNGAGNACGSIGIDINGHKKPNMLGEDYFIFWINLKDNTYSITPVGISGDGYSCQKGGNWFTSIGCTYQRMFLSNKMP